MESEKKESEIDDSSDKSLKSSKPSKLSHSGIKDFFNNLEWQDYLFFAAMVFFLLINLSWITPLKQLPSPIYGGDYYYHLGFVNHMIRGGSVFENHQYNGEAPWSPFLYQGSIALLSKITGANPIFVNMHISQLFLVISMIILYCFCTKFFKNK